MLLYFNIVHDGCTSGWTESIYLVALGVKVRAAAIEEVKKLYMKKKSFKVKMGWNITMSPHLRQRRSDEKCPCHWRPSLHFSSWDGQDASLGSFKGICPDTISEQCCSRIAAFPFIWFAILLHHSSLIQAKPIRRHSSTQEDVDRQFVFKSLRTLCMQIAPSCACRLHMFDFNLTQNAVHQIHEMSIKMHLGQILKDGVRIITLHNKRILSLNH